MLVGEVEVLQPITVHGQNVDHVDRFTYLGSILTCDSDAEADVNCRIGMAVSVFQRTRSIWSLSLISTDTKIWLYKAIVMSVGIFASETWKITTKKCTEVECFPSAMPAQDLARHMSGARNKRRGPDENWLKKTGIYCNRV